jgi:hypothetical protein
MAVVNHFSMNVFTFFLTLFGRDSHENAPAIAKKEEGQQETEKNLHAPDLL